MILITVLQAFLKSHDKTGLASSICSDDSERMNSYLKAGYNIAEHTLNIRCYNVLKSFFDAYLDIN